MTQQDIEHNMRNDIEQKAREIAEKYKMLSGPEAAYYAAEAALESQSQRIAKLEAAAIRARRAIAWAAQELKQPNPMHDEYDAIDKAIGGVK